MHDVIIFIDIYCKFTVIGLLCLYFEELEQIVVSNLKIDCGGPYFNFNAIQSFSEMCVTTPVLFFLMVNCN